MESYGWIVDKKTLAPVTAYVKFYNSKTGEMYAQLNADHFHVFTNFDPNNAVNDDDVILEIKAQGFKTYKATASNLLPQNDVYLEKSSLPIPQLIAAAALIAFATKKKKKVGAVTVEDVKPFLLIGGGLLAFDTVRRILQGIGFWDSAATKNLNSLSTDPKSFWNPNFWRTVNPSGTGWTYAIDITTANEWLNDLQNAFGPFNDDEEQAIGVMKRCRTQANCSFLADIFNRNTGQDLLTYLRGGLWPQDRLSDADVNTITQYISKLPKY